MPRGTERGPGLCRPAMKEMMNTTLTTVTPMAPIRAAALLLRSF